MIYLKVTEKTRENILILKTVVSDMPFYAVAKEIYIMIIGGILWTI